MCRASYDRGLDCRPAILTVRMSAMDELIAILPWAFCLVAAAAAITQAR